VIVPIKPRVEEVFTETGRIRYFTRLLILKTVSLGVCRVGTHFSEHYCGRDNDLALDMPR